VFCRSVGFSLRSNIAVAGGQCPEKEMKKKTQELSRRQMLAAMAISSVGGVVTRSAYSSTKLPSEFFRQTKRRTVTINAKPEPIAIDISRTALIVVDMQNDFGSKGGMFDRAGIDISIIQKAVTPTARALAVARRVGVKIIYLKMGFRPDLSDLGAADSVTRIRSGKRMGIGKTVRAPDGTEGRILIRDTWNTDIISELKPETNDVVIYKTRYSGFYQTDLDSILRKLKMRHLIITGCTTSICVDSTIRDAMFRDYQPVLLADCTAEPIGYGLPRSNHEASLLTVQVNFGWVSSSDEFINAVGAT
jgi:ureidoacrylate peracid hydrolase